jgi:hypothetical protein
MRQAMLFVVLLFIALLVALTATDIARNGFSPVDVLAVLVLLLFSTGIVGALRHRPPQ